MYWSDSGDKVVLALEENYYLLNFSETEVLNYVNENEGKVTKPEDEDEDDEGCEEAFEF